MARLRKPSPLEPSVFLQQPTQTRPTRSSPRKAVREVSYIISSDEDEENIPLRPKPSKRDLGDPSSIFQDDSFYTSKSHASPSTLMLTPRKQRILRPVESNSRLLRKLSDESLASPEKRPGSERRARRERNGTHEVDMDIGRKRNLMYAKSLARSVAGRELKKASSRIDVLDDTELRSPRKARRETKEAAVEVEEVEPEREQETSILCGDEEDVAQEVEEQQVETNEIEQPTSEEQDEEEDDDDIVLPVRSRNRRPQRRVDSDSESEYEEAAVEDEQEPEEEQSEEPQPLVSMRSPHRNGHSTISNWAQEVIDLTDSPKAPDSFALPESTRARSSSFAVSRPTTSSSDGVQPFLT
jgi:hypothetical protein